jgi:hypothetical protein
MAIRPALRLGLAALLACCGSVGSSAADAPAADVDAPVLAAWQAHHVEFNYFGITTLYTCDGLEGQVKRILLQLGARKDVKVRASGCPGIDLPSHSAWVDADFHSLAPATDVNAPDTVRARWTAELLRAQRPNFLGYGDCELVSDMRSLISANFSTRGLDYSAHCFPHVETLDDFQIKTDVLQMLPGKPT